ncbi:MAG TPA: 50S ribosomal protein L31e [Nitrososphaeraceae archaeon]
MSTLDEDSPRIYTVNLGKAWLTPQYKRTDRVVNMIREFARKHMKSKEVKLDQELNRHVWERGRTNPPRRLRVRMAKDEGGIVVVSLYEEVIGKPEEIADDELKENQFSEQEKNDNKEEEEEKDREKEDSTTEKKQEEIKEAQKRRPKQEKPRKGRKSKKS